MSNVQLCAPRITPFANLLSMCFHYSQTYSSCKVFLS
uniref:Uncharacterized protein n=1 Tax=Myoviridae sp. ctPkm1 TaxID=2825099 RepID=A0A8S5TYC3_9CAUD|nr:MAG TPA: hypothetical protein [Myoviridae sp. ctPkm1]